MKNVQENSNTTDLDPALEKKYPVSAGTSVFLIFSFLLILGLCKFSFYVLKNHRSAINRDTLVKTYVDVQPYSGSRREKSSYIVLKNQDKSVPAPFFVKNAVQNSYNLAVEKKQSESSPSVKLMAVNNIKALPSVKRPPVIRPPVIRQNEQKMTTVEEKEAVSLDNLMTSGLTLLTESDKKIINSEFLLQDEPVSNEQTKKETLSENKGANKGVSKKKKPVAKTLPATRWIDIAQLRKQLSMQSLQVQKEQTRRENKALLEMNDSKQIAALDLHPTSDVPDQQTEKSINPTNPSSSAKAERQKADVEPVQQTAVVQDIPFAGTTEQTEKTATTAQKIKDTTVLAGDTPSLWKIAQARGNAKRPTVEKKEIVKTSEKTSLDVVEETATNQKETTTIYRNGKIAAVIEQPTNQSLDWLDRQEAAVWTSMSQSDTPSVWSAAIEANSIPKDRAKAFRIADEQPAVSEKPAQTESPAEKKQTGNNETAEKNVINSSPVRTIGEEQKPEAKSNPLLLPLGVPVSSFNATTPTPATANQTYPTGSAPLKVDPDGLAAALSKKEQSETEKKQGSEDSGLVNKFFSFFNKNETDNAMPNIGSGTSVEKGNAKETLKNETEKKQQKINPDSVSLKKNPPDNKLSEKTYQKEIIPTEMRLTFRPESSEISAQSVKWIKAFGQKAKKDIQNAVEVRMSSVDLEVQEKRFAIIHSILTGVGMEDVQIIPIITDRTPHTIVLRMIVLPEEGYTEYTSEEGGIKERIYYRQW